MTELPTGLPPERGSMAPPSPTSSASSDSHPEENPPMRVRVLNLDGSLLRQRRLFAQYRPAVGRLEHFGPRIRLGCRFRDFHRFEAGLADATGTERDDVPWTTFYGSGDFHHVSLALVRRLRMP